MTWGKRMGEAQKRRDAKVAKDRDWTKYQATVLEAKLERVWPELCRCLKQDLDDYRNTVELSRLQSISDASPRT